jgi:nucleotide-sensitive chloride channel 1A
MLQEAIERTAEADSQQPLLSGDERILIQCDNVQLFLTAEQAEGTGRLFVTSRQLLWLSATDPAKDCALSFPKIAIHAISRDDTYFQHGDCIYCQLDTQDDSLSEVRLVVADKEQLQPVYDAMCEGAESNPDPDTAVDDGDAQFGAGEWFMNEDEVAAGAAAAAAENGDDDMEEDKDGTKKAAE